MTIRAALPVTGQSTNSPALTQSTVDQALAALAHPVRRAILDRLLEGDLTIGEITAPYDMSKPTMSRHIKVLEDAALIERTVAGRNHRCRLNPRGIRALGNWLDRYHRFWTGQLDELERFIDGRRIEENRAADVAERHRSSQTPEKKS